ncbi:MAG: PAS domain S-box protein [Candidatus Obscuribacterales bacterium]|nr:PAS domain S-box protein [Candidatus Obscuribacterales bacterium]
MNEKSMSLAQQGLLLIFVALVFELIFGISFWFLLNESRIQQRKNKHSEQFISTVNKIQLGINTIAWAVRPRPDWQSNPLDLSQANKTIESMPDLLDRLERLSVSDLDKQMVARSRNRWREFMLLRKEYKEALRSVFSGETEVGELTRRLGPTIGAKAEDLVRATNHDFDEDITAEIKELNKLDAKLLAWQDLQRIVLWVALFFHVLLSAYLARRFYKYVVARLAILVQNTELLAKEMPLGEPLSGTDELSLVDHNFRLMASVVSSNVRKERELIEEAVDLVCSIDTSFRFQSVNPASLQLLGFPQKELVGADLKSLIAYGADKVPTLEQIREKDLESFELLLTRKDSSQVETLWTARWSQAEQSIFCVATNFSEQKLEEQMQLRLIALLADEFRAPLLSLAEFYKQLESGQFNQISSDASQSTKSASRQIQQMLWLVDDLLDLNMANAGMLKLNIESVSVSDLISETVALLQPLAERKMIEINVLSTASRIEADPVRFKQILLNLISNAIKYSSKNTAITVSAETANDSLHVKVSDQGRGIAPDQLTRMFARFQQSKIQDRKIGTGIGLSICKTLVELHRGKISVESEVNKGSTFWFILPEKQPQFDSETKALGGEKSLCKA